MRERLSSSLTFVYKWIFPVVWITGFGLGTIAIWLGAFEDPAPPPPEMKWMFLTAWIAGSTFILWFSRRLRFVWLENDRLIVTNYRGEVVIPLRFIQGVSETRMWNPKTITVELRGDSTWGEKIVFIAPVVQ